MKKEPLLGELTLKERMDLAKKELDDNSSMPLKTTREIKANKPKIEPKLFVSGRLNRKNHNYITTSLTISSKLESEIKEYCRGGDLPILNYLIMEGLHKVKESLSNINIDMVEIESRLNEVT